MMRSALTLAASLLLVLSPAGAQSGTSILFIGNSFTFAAGSHVQFYRANTVTDLNNEHIGGVPVMMAQLLTLVNEGSAARARPR